MKVQGEQIFSIPQTSFAISPSAEGYTLAYSADGINFTENDESTPAGETLVVNGCAKFMKYKLVGNQSEVLIQY